jgi:hypothetical protein
MELKQFIVETLSSIVEAVNEAQQHAAKHGALVNPGGLMRSTQNVSNDAIWDNDTNNYARMVSFDIAVTVEEGSRTGAKVGVAAGILNLGAGGASENKQLAVSRLQFAIPVLLPTANKPGTETRRSRPSGRAVTE